jgi:branched-chain amino acid transport system permease protein
VGRAGAAHHGRRLHDRDADVRAGGYLTVLYFGAWTRGDEGFVIDRAACAIGPFDLSDRWDRYGAALGLFAVALWSTSRWCARRSGG